MKTAGSFPSDSIDQPIDKSIDKLIDQPIIIESNQLITQLIN